MLVERLFFAEQSALLCGEDVWLCVCARVRVGFDKLLLLLLLLLLFLLLLLLLLLMKGTLPETFYKDHDPG